MKIRKYLFGLLGFGILLGMDQWTKWLAYTRLRSVDEIPVLGQVFVLRYLENRGAAFGMLQNKRFLLIGMTAVVFLALVALYCFLPMKKKFLALRILTVLLAAGALGNLWDRIFRQYVIDFLYFKWIDFPIFNLADCYVVLAAIAGFLLLSFYYKEEDLQEIYNCSRSVTKEGEKE